MDYSVPYAGLKRFASTGTDTSGLNINNQNSNNMAIWAALIPAAASLVGSAINYFSQKGANDKNIALQREANAQNYQMFQEQNAFNLDMWNRQNAYNDPTQQAIRLQRAGINPNYVFGNGSVSEAGSLNSASPSPFVAPKVEPTLVGDQLAQGVYNGVNAFNQSQLINAQSSELRERAHNLSIQNELDFATLLDKIHNSHLSASQQRELENYMWRTHEARISVEQGNIELQNKNIANLQANTDYLNAKRVIEQNLSDSTIKLNEAQVNYLSNWFATRLEELRLAWSRFHLDEKNSQAQRAFLGNQVIHMMNEDAATFENIGITRDMMDSNKFKNYVGSIGSALIGLVAGYLSRGKSIVPESPTPGLSGPMIPGVTWRSNY